MISRKKRVNKYTDAAASSFRSPLAGSVWSDPPCNKRQTWQPQDGYDINLAKLIFHQLGFPCKITEIPWFPDSPWFSYETTSWCEVMWCHYFWPDYMQGNQEIWRLKGKCLEVKICEIYHAKFICSVRPLSFLYVFVLLMFRFMCAFVCNIIYALHLGLPEHYAHPKVRVLGLLMLTVSTEMWGAFSRPGLPVSLALSQRHGILCYLDFGRDSCQAVGVHAVWICSDSIWTPGAKPTNQPSRSKPLWVMGNKTHQKRPPRNGCGGWYLQMLREELSQPAGFATKKSAKSSTFIQTSDW